MDNAQTETSFKMKEKKRLPPILRAFGGAIISVFVSGLGHIGTEATARGFILFILEFVVGTGVVMTDVLLSKTGLIGGLGAFLAFKGFVIVDAFMVNLRSKSIKRDRKKSALILVLFVGMFLITRAVPVKRIARLEAFKIPSVAMLPTIQVGDMILADKKAYVEGGPQRGDLVIFRYPKDPKVNFIKRCVAVEGDVVEVVDKELIINGDPSPDYGVLHVDPDMIPGRDNFGPITVPPGEMFTMGDNRDNSNDSRFWGTVKVSVVLARARIVYWSWDKENRKVRWERIGETLD